MVVINISDLLIRVTVVELIARYSTHPLSECACAYMRMFVCVCALYVCLCVCVERVSNDGKQQHSSSGYGLLMPHWPNVFYNNVVMVNDVFNMICSPN